MTGAEWLAWFVAQPRIWCANCRCWNDEGCMCGAGMPCPVCNPCTREIPPAMQPGTTIIWSVTGELEDKPQ